tara:strand:+ start:1430 stop:1672 length:243 start_codon:yes stop_codon:yes gene_type:complete
MISKKTKYFNLINHLKQKNLDYKFNYKLFSEKGKPNYLAWYGEFFFNNKKYEGIAVTKRNVAKLLIDKAEKDIYRIVIKK